jgi:anaerobic magnesium-protoporphyrin IX monomethyl ester cyclase
MSKILLTHSYFYKFDPKQWNTKQPYPPLGTLYAASLLRENGFEAALFDSNLEDSPSDIIPVLQKEKPAYLVIYDDGFNYLTKMCLLKMREAAFRLAKIGQEYGCTVIISSSDASDHYAEYLEAGADYVIIGEGEQSLIELISFIERGTGSLSGINGIAYSENDSVVKTVKRNILTNLDSIPFPAWDLVDISKYKKVWLKNHGYFSLNIATTRGCPFRCNWCAKPIYGNRYNSRSPKNVADEIEFLINNYEARYFWFCDDIFGLKPGWINEFRQIVKERGLVFKYKIQSRVDLLLNENNIEALYDSGADTIWVGAESGSQKILDAMDKGTFIWQIYKVTRLLKANNIKVAFFIQLGYPGELKEDIRKTIKMITDLLPDDIGISVSYPLPGTKFYDMVKEDLKSKANWNDSDDLAMMFKNTYPPVYYRKLHRYIHRVYRFKKVLNIWRSFTSKPFDHNLTNIKGALSVIYHLPKLFIDFLILKIIERTV